MIKIVRLSALFEFHLSICNLKKTYFKNLHYLLYFGFCAYLLFINITYISPKVFVFCWLMESIFLFENIFEKKFLYSRHKIEDQENYTIAKYWIYCIGFFITRCGKYEVLIVLLPLPLSFFINSPKKNTFYFDLNILKRLAPSDGTGLFKKPMLLYICHVLFVFCRFFYNCQNFTYVYLPQFFVFIKRVLL